MKILSGRNARYRVLPWFALPVLLASAACDGLNPTATPEIGGPATATLAVTVTVTVTATIPIEPTAGGTVPPESTPPSSGGYAKDQGELINTLRKTFPAITPVDTINQPFMSVPATNLELDGEPFPVVQVYEYQDEVAAQKDAAKIQPNGDIPGFHVGWIAQPHFYTSGRIIVIYLGKDPAILSSLESALGKPFAIGEDVPSPGVPKP